MRESIRSIFNALHKRAFSGLNDIDKLMAMHELAEFSEYLSGKGITYFSDLHSMYKAINSSIKNFCAEQAIEGFRPLNDEEISHLIEWVPLERSTVEFMSNYPSISESVVYAATQKLIEQGQFWDEDGNGPDSLVETLFLDGRPTTGFHYLEGLLNSGEKEEYLAQAFSTSLHDAIRSGLSSFMGYFSHRDEELAHLLSDHEKLKRFNFRAAAKLCKHNAPALSLEIGRKMAEPFAEDLLELDALGRVEFIETCIALNDGCFEQVRAEEYLSYLARARHWPQNGLSVHLNIKTRDVGVALSDDAVTIDERRGPAFFYYVAKHFDDGPDDLYGLLKLAIEREWIEQWMAVSCMAENAEKFTHDFYHIAEIFRCEWLNDLDMDKYRKQINTKVIWHLSNNADMEDIITVFHNENLLDILNWDDLIDVVDKMMCDSVPKTQHRIVECIPKKYHSHFNSIKRFSLESDMGL